MYAEFDVFNKQEERVTKISKFYSSTKVKCCMGIS